MYVDVPSIGLRRKIVLLKRMNPLVSVGVCNGHACGPCTVWPQTGSKPEQLCHHNMSRIRHPGDKAFQYLSCNKAYISPKEDSCICNAYYMDCERATGMYYPSTTYLSTVYFVARVSRSVHVIQFKEWGCEGCKRCMVECTPITVRCWPIDPFIISVPYNDPCPFP